MEDGVASSTRLRSPSGASFFARHAELAQLLASYDAVATSGTLRMVSIVGEMGLGKGHLIGQFRDTLAVRERPPQVLHATRILGAAPLGFVGKILRSRFHVRVGESPDTVRERVASGVAAAWDIANADKGIEAGQRLAALLMPATCMPSFETSMSSDATETIGAFSDWICGLSRAPVEDQTHKDRVVVLIVEQLHAADLASLDLLHYVVRALRNERVLVVVTLRPDGSDCAPWRMVAPDIHSLIEVMPFSEDVMDGFLADLFRQVPQFPLAVRREIIARAEGNPDHCKELVRLLVDRGALWVDEHHVPYFWDERRFSKLDLPDTVRGVLQARLDGLVPAQKEILKMSAVMGRTFWPGALREILPPSYSDDEITLALRALRERELIKPSGVSSVSGEEELSFATQALCDAAYELVPRSVAVQAEKKVAQWLSERPDLSIR
jgi:predicted ATPase